MRAYKKIVAQPSSQLALFLFLLKLVQIPKNIVNEFEIFIRFLKNWTN